MQWRTSRGQRKRSADAEAEGTERCAERGAPLVPAMRAVNGVGGGGGGGRGEEMCRDVTCRAYLNSTFQGIVGIPKASEEAVLLHPHIVREVLRIEIIDLIIY